MMSGVLKCHHCHAEAGDSSRLQLLRAGVTSDCRPWEEEVRMFVCPACGAVQAPIDEAWRENVRKIYQSYDTYAAAGGEEQKVVAEGGAAVSARSRVILAWLASHGLLRSAGEVLDVGCGRGAFLAEFVERFPQWGLSGTEFDERNLPALRRLPRFKDLQTARFENLTGEYDLVSMIHVLEHIEDPVACLAALRHRASIDALLLVQVPDWSENPFALAISDHATHFTPAVLARVAQRAGWEPVFAPSHVVPKELTLLARASGAVNAAGGIADEGVERRLQGRLSWLRGVEHHARELRQTAASFGIFGTAVAGTWLAAACDGKVDFFVDEDPSRIGSKHLGIPIISPADVPAHSDVFIGMAPAVSKVLAGKYRGASARFHAVEAIEAS